MQLRTAFSLPVGPRPANGRHSPLPRHPKPLLRYYVGCRAISFQPRELLRFLPLAIPVIPSLLIEVILPAMIVVVQRPPIPRGSTRLPKQQRMGQSINTSFALRSCARVLPFPGEHASIQCRDLPLHRYFLLPGDPTQPLATFIISLNKCFPLSQSL